ncbi:MAG: OB-fold nucleic acid binding domain-containing protein, partial [Planctomycetes bacterium]|nr:OB-fold nucleic acid binding domain-containing protein [Planctomycetota bacterium]
MENEYREIRLQKAARLRELGVDPYALRTPERQPCAALVKAFEANNPEGTTEPKPVPGATAGRVLSLRMMGKKVAFLDVWDESGKIQFYINQKEVSPQEWEVFTNLDLGDWLWGKGDVTRTKTGEITLFVKTLKLLTKSLAVPPLEKSGGLQEKELRYRKRYADLLADPERRKTFATRSRVIFEIRKFLDGRGFMEVETPVLHAIAGGGTARPFVTHHNTLDQDLYLRIALELPLKRLLVGGFEKVYEIGRNFRNEGVDATHNPEFTMLELYQAYTDYYGMMELMESMLVHLLKTIRGADTDLSKVEWDGQVLNFTPPFRRVSYGELFKECTGIDMNDEAAVRAKAASLDIPKTFGHWKLVDELFDRFVQGKLDNPTFLTDYPTAICPL